MRRKRQPAAPVTPTSRGGDCGRGGGAAAADNHSRAAAAATGGLPLTPCPQGVANGAVAELPPP